LLLHLLLHELALVGTQAKASKTHLRAGEQQAAKHAR
jgi:hypothetical protein